MPRINKKKEPYKYEIKPEFDFYEKPKEELKPFRAGKDRFFHANYKHSIDDEEGYVTVYKLVFNEKESDYLKIRKMLRKKDIEFELEKHILNFLEDCYIIKANWERFDKDMIMLSTRFPGVLFRVECFGEDFPDDIWVAYAIDGKYYQEDGKIVYPEFNYERLV